MDLKMAISRAGRGLREDLRLYLVAVSSLTVAFLCLGSAMLAVTNLSQAAERWGQSRRLTVYLVDGARAGDVEQLRAIVEGLPEVASVEHVTAARARAQFMENTDVAGDLGELPADVFPASLEVTLVGGIPVQRLSDIAARVERFGAVDEVESYGGWFSRLESLITAGRGIALALCLLVVVCVIAVVGNTIRLAVAGRRDEIEVMKLCGATDGFVRRPFVVEGAAQGFAAALFSLVLLLLGYLVLRSQVNDTVAALSGVSAVFLHPGIMAALLLGGAAVGALGSALSLRRYLTV